MEEAKAKPEDDRKFVEHEVALVRKSASESFGFRLAYSNSFMSDDVIKSGHVIHWVGKGTSADEMGLRDGDQIIQVRGAAKGAGFVLFWTLF